MGVGGAGGVSLGRSWHSHEREGSAHGAESAPRSQPPLRGAQSRRVSDAFAGVYEKPATTESFRLSWPALMEMINVGPEQRRRRQR